MSLVCKQIKDAGERTVAEPGQLSILTAAGAGSWEKIRSRGEKTRRCLTAPIFSIKHEARSSAESRVKQKGALDV